MKEQDRERAEALYEELGGDLCICQNADVSHWCESCQGKIDTIMASFRLLLDSRSPASLSPPEAQGSRPRPGVAGKILRRLVMSFDSDDDFELLTATAMARKFLGLVLADDDESGVFAANGIDIDAELAHLESQAPSSAAGRGPDDWDEFAVAAFCEGFSALTLMKGADLAECWLWSHVRLQLDHMGRNVVDFDSRFASGKAEAAPPHAPLSEQLTDAMNRGDWHAAAMLLLAKVDELYRAEPPHALTDADYLAILERVRAFERCTSRSPCRCSCRCA